MKGSDNPLPSILINEAATDGSDFANPAADYRRLFLGEDGALHLKDSAGAVTDVGGSVSEITDIPTAQMDDTLVLAPDGAGGVEFRAETGSGGGYALDSYTIDGSYGDHFTTASLSGIWTRRNFTSGAETHQQGKGATYMRIATAGRAAGDGYYQTCPASDWTIAAAFVARGGTPSWGLAVIDSNGTGLAFAAYNSPAGMLLEALTTYTSYGGTFVQGPTWYAAQADMERKVWMYIRKSGTNYYGAYSWDGEIFGPETPAKALGGTGTPDRVGMICGPLGTIPPYVDVDWFNKIA